MGLMGLISDRDDRANYAALNIALDEFVDATVNNPRYGPIWLAGYLVGTILSTVPPADRQTLARQFRDSTNRIVRESTN